MKSAEKVVSDSYSLLASVIEQAYVGAEEDNLRQAFVYRHGLTILRLAEDAIHLEAERKCHSSPIVIRSMLESLFNLVAAVKNPLFAAEKICWEIEDEIKRLGKWLSSGADLAGTVTELRNLAERLRSEHGVKSVRSWTTYDCARAAELDQHYRTEYFLFSKKVHATQSGMISCETEIGRGHVLQVICFILICAAVHIVQLIKTKTPQAHVDDGTQLLQRLCDLDRDGMFRRLDERLRG